MNKLEIRLEAFEDVSEGDGEFSDVTYVGITAKLFIDGYELVTGDYPVDIKWLLTNELINQNLDLYTCSCGHAGCAGIHDYVALKTTNTEVEWHLPECFYREHLNKELIKSNPDLIFKFSLDEYVEELSDTIEAICNIQKDTQYNIVILPEAYPECYLITNSFDAYLLDAKKKYLDHLEFSNEHNSVYEPYRNIEFHLTTSTQTWILSFESAAWIIYNLTNIHDNINTYEKVRDFVKNRFGPNIKNGNLDMLDIIRTYDPEQLAASTMVYFDGTYVDEDIHDIETFRREKDSMLISISHIKT